MNYAYCITYHVLQAGETAAHVASRYGHPDVLTVLCSYEANLDLQDNVIHSLCVLSRLQL